MHRMLPQSSMAAAPSVLHKTDVQKDVQSVPRQRCDPNGNLQAAAKEWSQQDLPHRSTAVPTVGI